MQSGRPSHSTDGPRLAGPALGALCIALVIADRACASDAVGAPAAALPASVELAEVVVTATRKEQPLAKAPLSVSAFTASKLQMLDVKTPEDLARFVPGVRFNPIDNSIAIRGVESNAGAATTGIYIDDTPVQIRAIGTYPTNPEPVVFDLARVEVIRGPQGALFGAGAEGGAIRFITTAPDLVRPAMRVVAQTEATDGGGPSFETGVAANLPIVSDRLALRASVWARHDGGWVDRIDWRDGAVIDPYANRTDTAVARLALRWAATDRLTITPSLNLQSRRANDTSSWWAGRSDPSAGVYDNGNPERLPDNDRFLLAAVKSEYDADAFKVIANTSWFGRREDTAYDASLYNLSYLEHFVHPPLLRSGRLNLPIPSYAALGAISNLQGDFTQEIRVQSNAPGARLAWTAGLFFAANRQENREAEIDPQFDELNLALFGKTGRQLYGYGLLPNGDSYVGDNVSHDRQIAGFGQVDWRLTDRLTLTAGLRVAATHFDFTNAQDGPYNAPGPSAAAGSQSEHPLTPKFAVSYDFGDGPLLYASAAKGYRIGGANVPLPLAYCGTELGELGLTASPDTYRSDSIWSYEAGAKLRTPDGRMNINASVYYLRWSNIQQNVYLPDCGFTFTANLGQASGRGFDFDGAYRLDDHWSASLALGYTSARYTANSGVSSDAADPSVVRAGDALPGSPWKLAAGVVYDMRVTGRPAFARVDYEYSSAGRPGPVQDAATQQYDAAIPVGPPVGYLQLRVGVDVGPCRISAFVDNALNAHPDLEPSHEDQQTRLFIGTTLRPRTIGLNTEVNF